MTRESIETLLDATRLAGLETTEGGRILATISRPDAKGTAYRTALVEIDGERNVPLTRGAASVGAVAAAEDGTTFFTAKRLGEDGEEATDAQLWALPRRGEARELASRPGGFGGLRLAGGDRKSTRLNSSHVASSYAVFCLKEKKDQGCEEEGEVEEEKGVKNNVYQGY